MGQTVNLLAKPSVVQIHYSPINGIGENSFCYNFSKSLIIIHLFAYYYSIMPEMFPKSLFYHEGLRFSCKRCSACCRFEAGYVFLSLEDSSRLENHLCLDNEQFLKNYCRWVPLDNGKNQLSLKERENFDCIFWSEDGCSAYEARPLQCRAFPFWRSILESKKYWETTAQGCPGIGFGTLHSKDIINNWLTQRQLEPIITRSGS